MIVLACLAAALLAGAGPPARASIDAAIDALASVLKHGPSLDAAKRGPLEPEPARLELRHFLDAEPPISEEQGQRIRRILRETVQSPATQLCAPDEPGTPLVVAGVVRDASGKPIEGALLYVFHADSTGRYTRHGEMDERNARLFGYMKSDREGKFSFRTVRPGGYPKPYSGRLIPQHVHFVIESPGKALRRFQMVFRDDPRLDAYWLEWARKDDNPVVRADRAGAELRCNLDIRLK